MNVNIFLLVYDTLTGKIEKTLDGHRFVVRDVSWHPTRPEIVSASVRTKLIIFDRLLTRSL